MHHTYVDTNNVLYMEYTIWMHAHTPALVYGATHVPLMRWKLQNIGEDSCISQTRAFYQNLQIRNVESLA